MAEEKKPSSKKPGGEIKPPVLVDTQRIIIEAQTGIAPSSNSETKQQSDEDFRKLLDKPLEIKDLHTETKDPANGKEADANAAGNNQERWGEPLDADSIGHPIIPRPAPAEDETEQPADEVTDGDGVKSAADPENPEASEAESPEVPEAQAAPVAPEADGAAAAADPETPEAPAATEVRGNTPKPDDAAKGWRAKLAQEARKRWGAMAKKVASKFEKEAVKKFLLLLIKNPYFWAAILVIILIMILFSSCNQGKTPVQTLNPRTDQNLTLKMLAASGEKGPQQELLTSASRDAKTAMAKITTTDPKAQKIIDRINELLDQLIALAGDSTAVAAKIKEILALLEELRKLLPDQAAKIDAVISAINMITSMMNYYTNGHLVVNPKDLDYIRNFNADRRIVQMLVYLVTPKDQGGAGYERLKVKRIKFSYDTQRNSISRESEYTDQEEPNISAHYTGQAADISEIDCIKCTKTESSFLSSSKSKLPPVPIQVAWQTDKGFLESGGMDALGLNMHELFNNLANGAINDVLAKQLGDILGVDLDANKMRGRNLGEIARYVGMAVFKNTLDIPGDYELGNNLATISANVGRAYLADALGVPFEGIQGSNSKEMTESVGRSIVEEKMSIPAGSLVGNTSDEVLINAARRNLEESLHLSRGILSVDFKNQDDLKKLIGQGTIENSLGMAPKTFYGNISDVKKRVGKDQFEEAFFNPNTIDNWIGIPTGTTDNMLQARISIDDYNRVVGNKMFAEQILIYQKEDKRAEVYGVTAGDFNRFTSGDTGAFLPMGKVLMSKTLATSEKEQSLLLGYFVTKIQPAELDQDYIAGQFGLKNNDIGKIFVENLPREVFARYGQVEILNKISKNSKMSPYLQGVSDIYFYYDRLDTINETIADFKTNPDPEVRAKAVDTSNAVSSLKSSISIKDIQKNMGKIQSNLKFIREKAKDDDRLNTKLDTMSKAINEIIEGKEISDYYSLSPDSMQIKTDPQVGITTRDTLDLLTGKKTPNDLIYAIGLRKWEVEFDLPYQALDIAFRTLQSNGFDDADGTVLRSIGQAKLEEYGSVKGGDPSRVDKNLNLVAGTTADYIAGKLSKEAYEQKVGIGTMNNISAVILNRQLDLTSDPIYGLNGMDVTKLLNGGWIQVAIKIGSKGIDEVFGFPAGGTIDILDQTDSNDPTTILNHLGASKLGLMVGLNRPVSIEGDIPWNLGAANIEEELGLKNGEINDGNLAAKVRENIGVDYDRLQHLDASLNVAGGDSEKMVNGSMPAHEYILKVGNYLRDSYFYNALLKSNSSDWLKDKTVKDALIALAEQTGSPQDILAAAGAHQIGEILGLDYPVSIDGNFVDNLGQATIENRLGLKNHSFIESLDRSLAINGATRFESAFDINAGEMANARKASSGYWTADNIVHATSVDARLNIPNGTTKEFITGVIDLNSYKDRVGTNTTKTITVQQFADRFDLSDNYRAGAETIVTVFNRDPGLKDPVNQRALFAGLMTAASFDIDNECRFDPGTWSDILFTDPTRPDTTGPRHANVVMLEQGKKWLPKWLGMDPKYDPYIDLIYEQGTGMKDMDTMTKAIQEISGIPDEYDARRFLVGDFRGGFTAWGAAKLVKTYNDEFADQGFTLTYEDAKKAYFNDPEAERAIGDAAIDAALSKPGVTSISAADQANIRQEAIRNSRDQARKDLQYKAVDMQLHHFDSDIPAGFTKAMREGSSNDKWQMSLTYIGNMVNTNNPDIPADILPGLAAYFNPASPDFHKVDAISGATYNFLDTFMQRQIGDFLEPGTARALFMYGQTGNLGSPSTEGSLTKLYADKGINIVTNWGDDLFGIPRGSTQMIYDYYTKYAEALDNLHTAQTSYLAAKAAGDTAKISEASKNLSSQQNAVRELQSAFYTFVLTTLFQKQLTQMDQELGLAPGSSALLVGAGVQLSITGALSPWTLGIFILINLFNKTIDIDCTACGYYPEPKQFKETDKHYMARMKQVWPDAADCPLSEFNGADPSQYRLNAVAAAQWKTNKFLTDVLEMPEKTKDSNLRPSQIMTFREEDIDSLSSNLNTLYGPNGNRGNYGLFTAPAMWDHIHIGY